MSKNKFSLARLEKYLKFKQNLTDEQQRDAKFLKYLLNVENMYEIHLNSADLQDFVLRKLEKEYDINYIALPQVSFVDYGLKSTTCGTYNHETNTIKINPKFTEEPDEQEAPHTRQEKFYINIIELLDTYLHEYRHWAQYRCKRLDGDTHAIEYSSAKCHNLCRALAILNLSNQELKQYNEHINLDKIEPKISIYLNKYEAWLNADYYTSSQELDSRGFSINTIADLLDTDIKLTPKEENRLYLLKIAHGLIKDKEEETLLNSAATSDMKPSDLSKEIINLQKTCIEKNPKMFEDMTYFPHLFHGLYNVRNQYKIIPSLIESFRYHLDKELAHKLMLAILKTLEGLLFRGNEELEYNEIIGNMDIIDEFKIYAKRLATSVNGFELNEEELKLKHKCFETIGKIEQLNKAETLDIN